MIQVTDKGQCSGCGSIPFFMDNMTKGGNVN